MATQRFKAKYEKAFSKMPNSFTSSMMGREMDIERGAISIVSRLLSNDDRVELVSFERAKEFGVSRFNVRTWRKV